MILDSDENIVITGTARGGTSGFMDFLTLRYPSQAGCPADFNGDGTVNTLDVLAFLSAWAAGDASADFNDDGNIDTLDVLAFLNAWNAGC